MSDVLTGVLSGQELAHYRREGYVIPRWRLAPDKLAAIRAAVDKVIAENPKLRPEDLGNPHMLAWDGGRNPFLELARDPEILDMLEQTIGPDIALWITRILCKMPKTGREVPFHQDGQYWPIRPIATCSVWLAIDHVTPENGCMRFIPRSHLREKLYRHHTDGRENLVLNQTVDEDEYDAATAVDVILEPGQVSLHDVRLIHGSAANDSNRRRAALIMRYMPATSKFLREMPEVQKNAAFDICAQPLFLMRGRDRAGNDYKFGHDKVGIAGLGR
jgi:ectoine hydroxylase-related dioxygenase (phytanoyl-CoA dioxygenase family)